MIFARHIAIAVKPRPYLHCACYGTKKLHDRLISQGGHDDGDKTVTGCRVLRTIGKIATHAINALIYLASVFTLQPLALQCFLERKSHVSILLHCTNMPHNLCVSSSKTVNISKSPLQIKNRIYTLIRPYIKTLFMHSLVFI